MNFIVDHKDLGFSFALHLLLFVILFLLAPKESKKFTPLEINIVKSEKNVPNPEEKVIDLTKKESRVVPRGIHRSKKGIAKKEFKPVVGVTEESVADGGAVAVPLGNTLMGTPENKVNENVEYAPLQSVTRMPSFRVQVKPAYPEQARRLGIEGVVILEVAISSEGRVLEARIIEDPGFGLGESALRAIMASEFEPALSGETPVAVRVRIPVRFLLID